MIRDTSRLEPPPVVAPLDYYCPSKTSTARLPEDAELYKASRHLQRLCVTISSWISFIPTSGETRHLGQIDISIHPLPLGAVLVHCCSPVSAGLAIFPLVALAVTAA